MNFTLLSNAQLLIRKAGFEVELSPAINDTAGFSAKFSVQNCEVTSGREAECEAEIVGFRMWNVSLLINERIAL